MKHGKFASAIFVLGLAGIIGWKLLEPHLREKSQTDITDAADFKDEITIAVDGWAGYFPLCSPEMKKRLRRDGYGLQCIDDQANYEARFKLLDKNEIDFAVATVDSYVLVGETENYPGAIIAVIDESKGGDAIIARTDAISSLEQLKATPTARIAFTPNSPSHHLLKSIASHFDVEALKNRQLHVHTNGSEEALKKLKSREVDLAVLWEPEVSRALDDKDFVRLLGTEDTHQLVVDILLASRKVLRNDEAKLNTLLSNYFQTLKFYRDNQDVFAEELADYTGLRKSKIQPLLDGIAWQNLYDNAEQWFGVGQQSVSTDALASSIESAVRVLVDNGDFRDHPIPNRDPYRLISSQHIQQLNERLAQSGWNTEGASQGKLSFAALSDEQWANLQEIGSLKARNITFASGTDEITPEGIQEIATLAEDLKHYPTFRVEVRGHTATRGDEQMNLSLSQSRANAVASYLMGNYSLEENRVRAVGFGGTRPLAKKPNESSRAWRYRLPRVELVLVRETI